jgi:broad specificity phosphatase PhoE
VIGESRPDVVIVRHGETEWSLDGRHTGRTDVPLTENGRRRAARIADRLAGREFARVLTSPLSRARETAALAGFGDRAEPCDLLVEWDYGECEGRSTPQIREEQPGWWLWRDGCPGGESLAEVAARTDRVIAELRALDGDALVFAHGHVLRVLTARWLELPPEAGARFRLGTGCSGELGWERDVPVLIAWRPPKV